MDNMIEITGVDIRKFIREAYNLSKPQGLGFLHAQDGELSDEEVDDILSRERGHCLFSMDYVNGRSVKMHVLKEDSKFFIHDNWYDHSQDQLKDLLKAVGINSKQVA